MDFVSVLQRGPFSQSIVELQAACKSYKYSNNEAINRISTMKTKDFLEQSLP